VDLRPGDAAREIGNPKADRQPGEERDAHLLADEEAQHDAETDGLGELGADAPVEGHAGVGQREDGQDEERDGARERMLELLQGRVGRLHDVGHALHDVLLRGRVHAPIRR